MDNNISFEEIIMHLDQGHTILYPTDTIWGIGCDVFNQNAVEAIYRLKQRDRNKPFIILVDSIEMLKEYIPHIHPRIETLLFYHMKPLTIIYENPINLPQWVVTSSNTIAIRLVKNSYVKELLSAYKKPIISTSANVQGEDNPESYDLISKQILSGVDYIVPRQYGTIINKASSVIIKYDKEGLIDLVR